MATRRNNPNGTPSSEEIRARLKPADDDSFRARDAKGADEDPIIASDEDVPQPRTQKRKPRNTSTPKTNTPPPPPESSEEIDPWDAAPKYELDLDPEGTGDPLSEVPDDSEVLAIRLNSPTNSVELQSVLASLQTEREEFNRARNDYFLAVKAKDTQRIDAAYKTYTAARKKLTSALERTYADSEPDEAKRKEFGALVKRLFIIEENKNLRTYRDKHIEQKDKPAPAPESRVDKEERREPSIQKPPLSDAEKRARDRIFGVREAARKAYRSYAEFLEKESGKGGEEHNRLRKDYTEALATYLAAQVRIIETNARIDYGPFFAEKESYQNHIAELYSSAVVHGNEQLVRMDPSFDPHAALLSDSKLYATFSQACEGKVLGPAKGIFSVLEEPVLEEVQDMIGKNTVQAFYVARIEHVLALNAEHAGYPDQSPSSLPEEFQRPVGTTQDTTNKHVTYAHMRSMVLRQLEVYAKNAATPEQKERIRQVRQALKSDAEVLNAVKHYWLTGYKKRRVKPTGEELKKHGKGKIRTWALATLAGMFAIFTPAPSGDRQTDSRPELEDSEETRETRRREGAGYEAEESYASEPFILQANSEGASATFAQMLLKLRPERRDALMRGLGIPTNIHRREQAARMSELLGFTNVRADGRSVRVFTDTYFVLSPRGLEIQRAGDTQVLVNSENKKVAEYVER